MIGKLIGKLLCWLGYHKGNRFVRKLVTLGPGKVRHEVLQKMCDRCKTFRL